MSKSVNSRNELKKFIYIGASCFAAYATCYLGRNILSAMMPLIIKSQIYSHDSLASMGSAFFITYGFGQLINGFLGNRASAKIMVFTGLFFTGILVILFPVISSFSLSMILWAVCGFLCSMLWGPLSRLVGENTSERAGRMILTLLTIASIVGTGITYVLAIISTEMDKWNIGFFIAGFVLIVVSASWYSAVNILERRKLINLTVQALTKEKSKNTIKYLADNSIIQMTAIAMLNGVIRNAAAFWIPTYITERFQVSTSIAAAISSVLPFVNLGGTLISVYVAKLLRNNEIKVLAVFFGFSTVCFAVMYLGNNNVMSLNLIMLFTASAAMAGACNIIFSFYVLRFAGIGKISGVTGFLDFASYASASGANILFSGLLAGFDWNHIVAVWAFTSLAGLFFCLPLFSFNRKNDFSL